MIFERCKNITVTDFELLADAILKNDFNVKELYIKYLRSELVTNEFYQKIQNCKSLTSVEFCRNKNLEAELRIIEADSNVKHWLLNIIPDSITKEVEYKVNELLEQRKDNSLFIYNP